MTYISWKWTNIHYHFCRSHLDNNLFAVEMKQSRLNVFAPNKKFQDLEQKLGMRFLSYHSKLENITFKYREGCVSIKVIFAFIVLCRKYYYQKIRSMRELFLFTQVYWFWILFVCTHVSRCQLHVSVKSLGLSAFLDTVLAAFCIKYTIKGFAGHYIGIK